jgi:hypothetical protein
MRLMPPIRSGSFGAVAKDLVRSYSPRRYLGITPSSYESGHVLMHQRMIWMPAAMPSGVAEDTTARGVTRVPHSTQALQQPSCGAIWLTDVIRDCQSLAGAAIDRSPEQLLTLFSTAVARVPADAIGLDVTVARDVLGRTAGRIIRIAHLEESGDVSRAFIRAACAPSTGPWQSELVALARVCGATLRRFESTSVSPPTRRATGMFAKRSTSLRTDSAILRVRYLPPPRHCGSRPRTSVAC